MTKDELIEDYNKAIEGLKKAKEDYLMVDENCMEINGAMIGLVSVLQSRSKMHIDDAILNLQRLVQYIEALE